jgi:hypothetical protein
MTVHSQKNSPYSYYKNITNSRKIGLHSKEEFDDVPFLHWTITMKLLAITMLPEFYQAPPLGKQGTEGYDTSLPTPT